MIERKYRQFIHSSMSWNPITPETPARRAGRAMAEKHWRPKMKKYRCIPCGYIYDPQLGDPDSGVAPGTAFEDLPDDWQCPICFVGKDEFEPIED